MSQEYGAPAKANGNGNGAASSHAAGGQGNGAISNTTQTDAPPCSNCGWIMTRAGTCYRCDNCGTTTGCG